MLIKVIREKLGDVFILEILKRKMLLWMKFHSGMNPWNTISQGFFLSILSTYKKLYDSQITKYEYVLFFEIVHIGALEIAQRAGEWDKRY